MYRRMHIEHEHICKHAYICTLYNEIIRATKRHIHRIDLKVQIINPLKNLHLFFLVRMNRKYVYNVETPIGPRYACVSTTCYA